MNVPVPILWPLCFFAGLGLAFSVILADVLWELYGPR